MDYDLAMLLRVAGYGFAREERVFPYNQRGDRIAHASFSSGSLHLVQFTVKPKPVDVDGWVASELLSVKAFTVTV
jgi:hypothetical protein